VRISRDGLLLRRKLGIRHLKYAICHHEMQKRLLMIDWERFSKIEIRHLLKIANREMIAILDGLDMTVEDITSQVSEEFGKRSTQQHIKGVLAKGEDD
jgi:hypothetical protein